MREREESKVYRFTIEVSNSWSIQTYMDVESRKKVQKVVKLREVVTQMKYARVENIALCCALEINT